MSLLEIFDFFLEILATFQFGTQMMKILTQVNYKKVASSLWSFEHVYKQDARQQRDIFRPKLFYSYTNLRLKNSHCTMKTQGIRRKDLSQPIY